MDIINKIDKYYKEKGIHSLNFTCRYEQECSADCNNFTGPRSAFVPDKYSTSYPRIAFLSLDPGDGEADPKKRTPKAMRRLEQIDRVVEELHKGRHWYETHVWTQKIYNAISKKEITLEETKNYFAHLNSAKCCQNKPNAKEADETLFLNCREFLSEELLIISPQILVTQGNLAHKAVKSIVKSKNTLYDRVYLVSSPMKFLWVKSYHPSAYGYYNKQKKDLDNIAGKLSENISRVV